MSKLMACRACLATDVKLYCMCKFRLKKAYESFTDTKVHKKDNYPQYLCNICAMLVLKCEAFKDKCERAKELLNQTIMQFNKITTNHIRNLDRTTSELTLPLTVHKVDMEAIPVYKEGASPILQDKRDVMKDFVDDMKDLCNYASDIEEEIGLLDGYGSSDNEPLAGKSNKKANAEDSDSVAKEKEKELSDIEVVVLTTEQQIEEVQARKDSFNYQNSIFKCELCFKGFITDTTYNNHMFKHDPESGPYSCDVCLTRWPDPKSLRSHLSIAHEKKYLCKLCNTVSRSLYRAKEHSLWHNGYLFRCKVCGSTFSKSTSYLTHLRMQHPSKHCCDLCGDSFIGENGLKIHKKKAHRQQQKWKKEHKCPMCGIQFHNLDALKMHSSMSDPTSGCDTTLRSCPECGHSFLNDETVRDHMKTHLKNKVKCNDCNRTFAHKRSIAVHYQRVHMGVRKARMPSDKDKQRTTICEICGLRCHSKSAWIHHQRIHTGEKPYQCPECPNRFSVFQRLKIHRRTHSGERPYKCSLCPKAFKHKAALNRHNRVHTGAKPYECIYCGKSFSQSNSMKLHVNTVHLRMPAPYKKERRAESNQVQQASDDEEK